MASYLPFQSLPNDVQSEPPELISFGKPAFRCYLNLRQRANLLISEKPKLEGNIINWTDLIQAVFAEGENSIRSVMAKTLDSKSVREILNIMESKLELKDTPSTTPVLTRTQKETVAKFRTEVQAFIHDLLNWIYQNILKILADKPVKILAKESVKIDAALQDVFDQGIDLLWGIYA